MNFEPIATYRMQLRPGFGFAEAEALIPYLQELGISHLYASPYLQATAGSTHGYDVVDPSRVNEELGGHQAHARLCEALQRVGIGQLLDIVPNHMAIAGRQNPWWWDVLQNGPSSRYATYFDVDWEASEERWPNRVLLPVLGDHYGRVLEDGQLELSHEEAEFVLHYYEHVFPIDPSSLPELLSRAAERSGSEQLAFIAESHARLPRPTVTARQAVERRHRDKAVLARMLADHCRDNADVRAAIDTEVGRFTGDADALDALIERQNYRLAFWRTASRDLGYRRFFDIKDLAGLRVEDPDVFRAVHKLPIDWVNRGWVDGLRIDHPDGLREPAEYFRRLRRQCPDAWLLAEKILVPGEELPSNWPIEGTTGYEFLNLAGNLFVDARNEPAMTELYAEFTGEEARLEPVVQAARRQVLAVILGSELNRLTSLFVNICEQHRRHRDYSRVELHDALAETAACFPVYRSYVSESDDQVTEEDKGYISQAIERAKTERDDIDPELFAFLKRILLLEVPGTLETELALRFQQVTSAAMAKGVEDTALYRYLRLVALNEVGGEPNRFGISISEFHQACETRQRKHPQAMLNSTTHDTKRSEDLRARLALLSEIPERWGNTVRQWAEFNDQHRQRGLPDRNTEYLLYQTLVGAWPIGEERIIAYMEKATREAKRHTSWRKQNAEYERALREFITAIMNDGEFTAKVRGFVDAIATPGWINSLSQTLIKLTAPGVPDIYQGADLWEMSLVDPDNRRPVDFTRRQTLLSELNHLPAEDIMARLDEGLPKLWLIRQTLHARRRHAEAFGPDGTYRPLTTEGSKSEHAVAFSRGERVVTVCPRLVMGLADDWMDTTVELPDGQWHNVLTDDEHDGGTVQLANLSRRFPVVLLERR
ncbi:malto-oligosyltrehalose synthase [candidate division GN15 bacterium]|nr:malto-oligosyltrehalose synthase [candidate division GN15 bacterium]